MENLDRYRKVDGTLDKEGQELLQKWIERNVSDTLNYDGCIAPSIQFGITTVAEVLYLMLQELKEIKEAIKKDNHE